MALRYKFKNELEYKTIPLDTFYISAIDLKRAVVRDRKLGRQTDFDLDILNAQDNSVYTSDDAQIPKNTTIIVVRKPLASGSHKIWDIVDADLDAPIQIECVTTTKLDDDTLTEEDKIQSIQASDSTYNRRNWLAVSHKPNGVPSGNYLCFKCNQPGHYAHNCPNNNDMEIKKTTGIPRSFLSLADKDTPGAKISPHGAYMVNEMEREVYSAKKADVPIWNNEAAKAAPAESSKADMGESRVGFVNGVVVPDDLKCGYCLHVVRDCVMMPECACSLCDECARKAILESDKNACPLCGEENNSIDELIPCRKIRDKVVKFLDSVADTGSRSSPDKSDKGQDVVSSTKADVLPTPVPTKPVSLPQIHLPNLLPLGANTAEMEKILHASELQLFQAPATSPAETVDKSEQGGPAACGDADQPHVDPVGDSNHVVEAAPLDDSSHQSSSDGAADVGQQIETMGIRIQTSKNVPRFTSPPRLLTGHSSRMYHETSTKDPLILVPPIPVIPTLPTTSQSGYVEDPLAAFEHAMAAKDQRDSMMARLTSRQMGPSRPPVRRYADSFHERPRHRRYEDEDSRRRRRHSRSPRSLPRRSGGDRDRRSRSPHRQHHRSPPREIRHSSKRSGDRDRSADYSKNDIDLRQNTRRHHDSSRERKEEMDERDSYNSASSTVRIHKKSSSRSVEELHARQGASETLSTRPEKVSGSKKYKAHSKSPSPPEDGAEEKENRHSPNHQPVAQHTEPGELADGSDDKIDEGTTTVALGSSDADDSDASSEANVQLTEAERLALEKKRRKQVKLLKQERKLKKAKKQKRELKKIKKQFKAYLALLKDKETSLAADQRDDSELLNSKSTKRKGRIESHATLVEASSSRRSNRSPSSEDSHSLSKRTAGGGGGGLSTSSASNLHGQTKRVSVRDRLGPKQHDDDDNDARAVKDSRRNHDSRVSSAVVLPLASRHKSGDSDGRKRMKISR